MRNPIENIINRTHEIKWQDKAIHPRYQIRVKAVKFCYEGQNQALKQA